MASPIRRRHAALRQPRGRIGHGLGKSKAQAPLLDAVPSPRGSPGTWVLTDCSHLPCFPHACLISLSCLCAPLYPPATSSTHRHTHTLTAHTPQPMHIMTSTHVCTQCAPMERCTRMHQHVLTCTQTLGLVLLPHTSSMRFACTRKRGHAQLCVSHTSRPVVELTPQHKRTQCLCSGSHTDAHTHTNTQPGVLAHTHTRTRKCKLPGPQ